jgi:hypothetical protein
MIVDVTGAIEALESGTAYTVTRYAAGSYVNGRYVRGAASTFTIAASIQPAGEHDVLRLPEGLRDRKTIAIFTTTPLQHASEDAAVSDRITYLGEVFEVSSIDEWNETGGYNKALATKVQAQAAFPPASPVVTTPGAYVAPATVTISGTCELGTVSVQVYFGTVLKATVEPDEMVWTATVLAVAAGVYTVTATATDVGGTSLPSAAKTLTVTAPTPP